MSTPLKLLVAVIFASIFLGVVIGLQVNFGQTQSKAGFLQDAEDFAEVASALSNQDPPAQQSFSITIPSDCSLSFEGENIIASTGEGTPTVHDVGISISGDNLDPGSYDLQIERINGGIKVSVKE